MGGSNIKKSQITASCKERDRQERKQGKDRKEGNRREHEKTETTRVESVTKHKYACVVLCLEGEGMLCGEGELLRGIQS